LFSISRLLSQANKKTKLPVGAEIEKVQNSQPVTANGTKCGFIIFCQKMAHKSGRVSWLNYFISSQTLEKFYALIVNRHFFYAQLDLSIEVKTPVPKFL
jgi:hypothetical protein